MSVLIDCNGKKVLKFSNSLFGLLHETIISIIEQENLDLDPSFELMLKKTDQNIYGPGAVYADIAEYLKTKKEVLLFAYCVKRAIEVKYENFNQFKTCIEHLWNFYDELIKYSEVLN